MDPKLVTKIEKALEVKVYWGKFKGQTLEECPSWYLKWVAENFSKKEIAEAADVVWRWREKNDCHIDD